MSSTFRQPITAQHFARLSGREPALGHHLFDLAHRLVDLFGVMQVAVQALMGQHIDEVDEQVDPVQLLRRPGDGGVGRDDEDAPRAIVDGELDRRVVDRAAVAARPDPLDVDRRVEQRKRRRRDHSLVDALAIGRRRKAVLVEGEDMLVGGGRLLADLAEGAMHDSDDDLERDAMDLVAGEAFDLFAQELHQLVRVGQRDAAQEILEVDVDAVHPVGLVLPERDQSSGRLALFAGADGRGDK